MTVKSARMVMVSMLGAAAVGAGLLAAGGATASAAAVAAAPSLVVASTSAESSGLAAGVAPTRRPTTGKPVLIKAAKDRKGKNRILTVDGNGKISFKRSKPTASNGLSTYGTYMSLKTIKKTKHATYVQIMSLNDSEEKDAYCLTMTDGAKFGLAVCDEGNTNQHFGFEAQGRKKFAIFSPGVGYWKASGRQLKIADIDTGSFGTFRVAAKKS
jgi:hypothetical protein